MWNIKQLLWKQNQLCDQNDFSNWTGSQFWAKTTNLLSITSHKIQIWFKFHDQFCAPWSVVAREVNSLFLCSTKATKANLPNFHSLATSRPMVEKQTSKAWTMIWQGEGAWQCPVWRHVAFLCVAKEWQRVSAWVWWQLCWSVSCSTSSSVICNHRLERTNLRITTQSLGVRQSLLFPEIILIVFDPPHPNESQSSQSFPIWYQTRVWPTFYQGDQTIFEFQNWSKELIFS